MREGARVGGDLTAVPSREESLINSAVGRPADRNSLILPGRHCRFLNSSAFPKTVSANGNIWQSSTLSLGLQDVLYEDQEALLVDLATVRRSWATLL